MVTSGKCGHISNSDISQMVTARLHLPVRGSTGESLESTGPNYRIEEIGWGFKGKHIVRIPRGFQCIIEELLMLVHPRQFRS